MSPRTRLLPLAVSLAVTTPLLVGPADAAGTATRGSAYRPAVTGTGGAVATESPDAAAIAAWVLRSGGNAVDAAVAAVLAVGVAKPEACGIGGGGFLVARGADGRVSSLDFREKAPARGYTFSSGIGTPTGLPTYSFGTGHGVVGVPGLVAGLAEATRRLGTRPFGELVAPAARLARRGITVTPDLAAALEWRRLDLVLHPESARVYLKPDLTAYRAGEVLRLPEYAASLEAVAAGGADAFYRGSVGRLIAREMLVSGPYPGGRSAMTAQDLADYRAVWRTPVTTTYRGAQVVTVPPPSSGGIVLAQVLNLLEGFDVAGPGRLSADSLHLAAEAQGIAWADRAAYVADPDVVAVPTRPLTGKAYADRRRGEIDPARAGRYAAGPVEGVGPSARRPATAGDTGTNTTNVSVVDRAGGAAVITCSLEQALGSAVVARGTGFLLNSQLTDFSEPGTANAPAPGKRPRSSMTPTIVVRDGRVVLAVGGAGGPAIPMGVVHTVLAVVDGREDVATALDAPRVDAHGFGEALSIEDARLPAAVVTDLERRGHELVRRGEYVDLPLLTAVARDRRTGLLAAVADPRGESGSAAVG